jgi:hypothetical protein
VPSHVGPAVMKAGNLEHPRLNKPGEVVLSVAHNRCAVRQSQSIMNGWIRETY